MNKLIAFVAFMMMSQAYAQTAVQVVPAPQAPQPVYAQVPAQAPVAPVYQVQQQPASRSTLVYDERTNQLMDVQPSSQVAQAPSYSAGAPSASANGNNPIVILNNQRVGQAAVQEMPVSIVEESPLKASAADTMRKKRQATEVGTEDSIVQALERARIEDEMRRRDRFNNALQPVEVPAPTPVPIYVQPAPPQVVQQVAPAPVIVVPVIVEKKKEVREVIVDTPAQDEDSLSEKAELRQSYKEERRRRDDVQQYYVGALVGTQQAANSTNVHSGLSSGIELGVILPSRMVVEGGFNYSNYNFDDVVNWGQTISVKQYGLDLAVKYQLLPGRIRPVIGVAGGWTRRSFDYGYGNFEVRTSDAFDIGPVAGLDVVFSDSFSIGVDFRYMTNVFYRDSSSNNGGYAYGYKSQPWGTTVPEKTDYYTAAAVAKFMF